MDFTIHSLKVTILIRIFSICLFPSIRIISKRIFFCFLKFHMVCFEKKQKWKKPAWIVNCSKPHCCVFGIFVDRSNVGLCFAVERYLILQVWHGLLLTVYRGWKFNGYRLALLLRLSTNPLWCFVSCFAI